MTANPKVSSSVRVSTGTGFFVSTDGHVVTNAHVVKNCRSIILEAHGLTPKEAPLVAIDSNADLALIKAADAPSTIPALQTHLRVGEPVAVYGFPLFSLLPSSGNFTLGHVSATAGLRDNPKMLQISAPVQPGNSGGPLIDHAGNILRCGNIKVKRNCDCCNN